MPDTNASASAKTRNREEEPVGLGCRGSLPVRLEVIERILIGVSQADMRLVPITHYN